MKNSSDHPFALSRGAIQVRLSEEDEILEAVVTGFKSPAGVAAVLDQIGHALRQSQLSRVLIDATGVVGQMATSDHAAVGAAVALHLGQVRCAVVARVDRPRGEIAPSARAGGVDYRAFDERADAVGWLRGDSKG